VKQSWGNIVLVLPTSLARFLHHVMAGVKVRQLLRCRIVDLASDRRARRPDWNRLAAKAVVRIIPVVPISVVRMIISVVRVIISVVRVIIPVVGVIIQKGTSKKEIAIVPETISVPEMISVLEMPSSVFRKAMATKTTPAKPTEMTTATTEMAAAATEMATAAAEASTMPATSSAMAAASSAVSECRRRNRQDAGQNQTGKETVK
jgi:hypothetical protein